MSKILKAQVHTALQLEHVALPTAESPQQPSSSLPLANDGQAMDVAEPQAIVNAQQPAAHVEVPDDADIFDSDAENTAAVLPKPKKQKLKKGGKSASRELVNVRRTSRA